MIKSVFKIELNDCDGVHADEVCAIENLNF